MTFFCPVFLRLIIINNYSLASATTGLVGQPKLQKYIQNQLGTHTSFGQFGCNLISSAIVSPIYIVMTNPLSRLEVIMQTSSIKGKSIPLREAIIEMVRDSKEFGLKGMFRGQGIGIMKAIISLSMFHQGRLYLTESFKNYNTKF